MKSKSKPDRKGSEREGDLAGGILGSLTGFLGSLGDLAGRQGPPDEGQGQEARDDGSGPAGGTRASRILDGLAEIAEKLQDLSAKGESLSGEQRFTVPSKEGGVEGVYGFSLKMGLGKEGGEIRAKPFGNIRRDKETGKVVVQEISEPLVDVFEEDGIVTLVAEMPGVGAEDVRVEVQGDVLTMVAEKGTRKYRKETLLRHAVDPDSVTVTCNNGIVTIRAKGLE